MSRAKKPEPDTLFQGTLDLLVLKTLSRNRVMHGYAIARFIQQISRDALRIEEVRSIPHCIASRSKTSSSRNGVTPRADEEPSIIA